MFYLILSFPDISNFVSNVALSSFENINQNRTNRILIFS